VIVAAKHLGLDQGAVTHVILSAVWKDDLNIADAKDIASALTPHGMAPGPLIDASQGPEIAAKAGSETRDAIEHGIFGSPTYVIGEDWFFGQDRLAFLAEKMGVAGLR
jgi:2-hydroxychromene-2-carboxylate isomerase